MNPEFAPTAAIEIDPGYKTLVPVARRLSTVYVVVADFEVGVGSLSSSTIVKSIFPFVPAAAFNLACTVILLVEYAPPPP